MTDDDLSALCEREKVEIAENGSFKFKGEYVIYDAIPFILLRPDLKREMKLWVGLHEFGHHLLHYPVNHRFSKGIVRKMDREANFFAAIALMPTWLIASKTLGEIIEEYNYPKQLIRIRKEIYDTYKI